MANHVKPTREELEAASQKALNDLENLPPEENENQEIEDNTSTTIENSTEFTEENNEDNQTNISVSPSKPIPSAGIPGSTNWQKRYTDSSREAKVLATKNREINGAVDEAAELPQPTDDEMKEEFSDWDELDPVTQRLAKSDLLNKRRFDLIHAATQKYKKIEDWNEKVDTFTDDPKTLNHFPELEGKVQEFRLFASKPTRAGMDFEDLVLAFMGDEAKNKKPSHKGQSMFPTGNGGSKSAPITPKDDKLTPEQGRALMKTNYKLFKEYLKSGKIKSE